MKKRLNIVVVFSIMTIIGMVFGTLGFASEKMLEDERLLRLERSLSNNDNGILQNSILQKKINRDNLSQVAIKSPITKAYAWESHDPNDLNILKNTSWEFTFKIMDIFSDTVVFASNVDTSPEGVVSLKCYDKNGDNSGIVVYAEVDGLGKCFIASISGTILNEYYTFVVNGDSANGVYSHQSVATGTFSDGYDLTGIKTGGGGCIGLSYQSTYDAIQWGCRGDDFYYCIDIFDINGTMIHQAAACGDGLHSFSPKNNLQLAPGTYSWKIWSNGGYGGEGFYGEFSVNQGDCAGLPYQSSYYYIQWGCRNNDTFYCLDICDTNWNVYSNLRAVACGEGLHYWSPKEFVNNVAGMSDSELSGFTFNWRIWSPTGYGGNGFEGSVTVP